MKKSSVTVTKPSLPPLIDFIPYLESIWESRILTNGGPFHKKLEAELRSYLGVPEISLFSNGTIALLTALKALDIKGEVITTPYSFVATSHSLLWNNLSPVFVDIDPETLNLDPKKIEAAITSATSAIMPVHVYGTPCDVEAIESIAVKNGLKVIYDAAHAFGVTCHCGSVLNHGDLSVLSFHATKVFNTFEGGAIVCKDLAMKAHIDNLKNFGFLDEVSVVDVGINGKMNEVSAALGLAQLEHIRKDIERRRIIDSHYREALKGVEGIRCVSRPQFGANYSYFPILILPSFPATRDEVYYKLKELGFNARRYFFPLISDFSMYRTYPSASSSNLPVASRTASRVLCLPIYPDLSIGDQGEIIEAIVSLRSRNS